MSPSSPTAGEETGEWGWVTSGLSSHSGNIDSKELLTNAEWTRRKNDWLPSKNDGDFVASLMTPCRERGKFAPWISVPKVGIDSKPGDFEYVKVHQE